MYKIVEKGALPNGTKIQLEDWSEQNTQDFPNLYGLTIAAYPPLTRADKSWAKLGDPFRLEIQMNSYAGYTNERVQEDYNALIRGDKTLEDLSIYFSNPDDRRRLGIGSLMPMPMPPEDDLEGVPLHRRTNSASIKTIEEMDEFLEKLWSELEDISMDPDTETIEEPFLGFSVGTHRETIWHWFDKRYSKGIAYLLYRADGVDRTDVVAKFTYLNTMTFECETVGCVYNKNGECRYALVHEQKPVMSEENGCESGELASVV